MTSGILPSIEVVALDLFCRHLINVLYVRGIRVSAAMATVRQNKLTQSLQSLCVLRVMMVSKKIRLDRPVITEILVADTDFESGAEGSDDDEFYEL